MSAIYIVIFDETLINEHPFSLAILLGNWSFSNFYSKLLYLPYYMIYWAPSTSWYWMKPKIMSILSNGTINRVMVRTIAKIFWICTRTYYYILLLRKIQIYEYSFIQIIVVTMGAIYIPVLGETYIIKHLLKMIVVNADKIKKRLII